MELNITTNDKVYSTDTDEVTVDFLNRYIPNGGKVIDVGTGTGVLAITAKILRPQNDVEALDISQDAVDLATINVAQNNVDVDVSKNDLLKNKTGYDFVVANLPCYTEAEYDDFDPEDKPKVAYVADTSDPLKLIKKCLDQASIELPFEGKIVVGVREEKPLYDEIVAYAKERDLKVIEQQNFILVFAKADSRGQIVRPDPV